MTNGEIDNALDLTSLAKTQEDYFLINNKYQRVLPYQALFDAGTTIEITIYDGPEGKGYVVILLNSINNNIKCINFGPEDYRDILWVLNE